MNVVIPNKLKPGDEVRIVAPSRSLGIISKETIEIANKRFEELGLKLSFGKNVNEMDDFKSSSIKSRIEDLHEAFSDKNIKGVFCVIGGFNSNQLLGYIDWEIIKKNPKIFCGYSDTTVLNNAMFTKTGLVNYSGLAYSTFGQKLYFDYSLELFKKCFFEDEPFNITASSQWSDDAWYINQDDRKLINNDGFLVINEGDKTTGTIIGGNLNTFNLLHGTEFMPDLTNSILFLEDDEDSKPEHFDRDLQSLIHQPGFGGVKGLVIGRFQNESRISNDLLTKIIKTKKELENLPVVANVDFGHTDPKITFPVGGTVEIDIKKDKQSIKILTH